MLAATNACASRGSGRDRGDEEGRFGEQLRCPLCASEMPVGLARAGRAIPHEKQVPGRNLRDAQRVWLVTGLTVEVATGGAKYSGAGAWRARR